MPRSVGKVTVDTTKLKRATKQLVARLTEGGNRQAHDQAERTATKIRDNTPVLTGALRSTVTVTDTYVAAGRGGGEGPGWGVTYGSGLTYHYVQNVRRKIVKKGMRGCRQEFKRALDELAATETNRL